MSWGHKLLDPDVHAAQEKGIALAANPWGHKMGLPSDEVEAADDEPTEQRPLKTPPPEKELGLSVASIEQRLAVDPKWWEEALALEVARASPRKSALRAILRTAEDEGAPAEVIEKAREVLDAL